MSRRRRIRLAAGVLGAVATLVTACSMTPPVSAPHSGPAPEPDTTGGKPVIGVSAIDLTTSFFVEMREAGDKAAADYGVHTTWQSAENSVGNQVSTIQNFINQQVDAILIDPLDKNALTPVINRATRAGIPVVTMGNKVEAQGNYSTLYQDARNMAMVARATGARLGGHGKVALLVGSRGNYVSDTRERAFRRTLAQHYPGVELVSVQPTSFDTREASNTTVTWMTTYPNLDAVACIQDTLCLAAKSTADSLRHPNLKILGHDGQRDLNPLINDGSMTMNVLTGAGRVGYWNIAVGARLARGAELPREMYLRSHFVTTKRTADLLRSNGLTFPHITPDHSERIAAAYRDELGPGQPDAAMNAGDQ